MGTKSEALKQFNRIAAGTAEIVPEEDLKTKLEKSISTGKPLRIKLGLDPTAPDIHLGHTVVLHKLRQFQEFGHQVVLIIGDYTGRIGDPSGKSETRKQLTEEEIEKNAATYKEQIFKVLDPDKTELRYNGEWLSRLSFADVIRLASNYTVARMLERDDFSNRFHNEEPISIHEFLYPLMQGYDSVAIEADVELGGTDQKFNLLIGRTLQREYGLEPQVALMMPILEGLDGKQKMSKSLGNYIGITESPREMYGKTMSISDDLLVRYLSLVTRFSEEEVSSIEKGLQENRLHPRDIKMQLAREIVSMYHSQEAAREAEEEFKRVFSKGQLPDSIPEFTISAEELKDNKIWLPKLLSLANMTSGTSEARRMIKQGAVKINDKKIENQDEEVEITDGMIIRVGKRKFIRIRK
ncbi:MAG: tyrosine--tRNA ligase [Bacillota bacterium]|jgi:tyrosyl-tRNA synthetase